MISARYHVNALWHGIDPPAPITACAVAPGTPSRALALPPPPPPVEASVPAVIPAWKGKAGLLDAVAAAVLAASGRVADAWAGASEWSRDSYFMLWLAAGLDLKKQQIDDMFRAADAIQR